MGPQDRKAWMRMGRTVEPKIKRQSLYWCSFSQGGSGLSEGDPRGFQILHILLHLVVVSEPMASRLSSETPSCDKNTGGRQMNPYAFLAAFGTDGM